MTRYRLFLTSLILVLFLIVAGAMALAQGESDQCLWLKADGTYEWVPCVLLLTPTQEITGVPSSTPTIAPTEPPTPTPTPSPTPVPTQLCTGRPVEYLNVRDGVWGALIGQFQTDTIRSIVFLARAQDTQGAWWYAFWWEANVVGWVHGDYITWRDQSGCDALPADPPPVLRAFAIGPQLISPTNENALWGNYAACRNGNERLCFMLRDADPTALITYRSLTVCGLQTDGPELWQWYSPSAYAACIYQDSPDGFDYYEVINERDPPDNDWGLFVDWHIEVCDYFNDRGRRCAAFSFGPGNPASFETWGTLWRWVEWANTHPLPDGSYNAIAWHSAGYAAPGVPIPPEDEWQVSNPWIAGRDVMVDVWLQQHLGVSLSDFRGPVFITELYFGDHWTCPNLAASIAYTSTLLDQRLWLQGGAVWNFGGDGVQWVNYTPCRDTIITYL